jgi:hypothetical protein
MVTTGRRPASRGGQGWTERANQPFDLAEGKGGEPLPHSAPARSTPFRGQARNPPNPSVPVRLPDGQTIPDSNSPTGTLMSPVADLTPVADSGRQTGAISQSMLSNPETAESAASYLGASLGAAVGQDGIFDYQRQGNHFTGFTQLPQFRDVSNVNVGLFSQQAGLTLDETLRIAGKFAHFGSSNARPNEPYGLDPRTAQFIRTGFNLGQRGAFDKRATH